MPALTSVAIALAVSTAVLAATGFWVYRLYLTLPDFRDPDVVYDMPRTSIVYAADGSVLAQWHGDQNRTIVPIESMALTVRDAVVAAEDERFYEHQGADLGAAVRAARSQLQAGGRSGTGTSITQQLVRILFSDGDRGLVRKVEETLLAFQLETESEKDRVLEAYLNAVYFGHGAYGVESAAQHYFGIPASQLDVEQAALLAGLIAAPGRYSPVTAPDAALERRDAVIAKMYELGFISGSEADAAQEAPLGLSLPEGRPAPAPYFVEWVKRDLIERLGTDAVYNGGLRVQTTLDPAMQQSAERAIADELGAEDDPETALLTLEPSTGRVLAMVGGRDFDRDQFNLATQGRRQPGSAFKTFVLVRALEEGVSPDEVFDATPFTVRVTDGTWTVQNYENDSTSARLSLTAATAWSVNAVYARLIMRVGPEDVVDVARRMGITSPLEPNPAIALGGLSQGVTPLEMASAYGTIANGGVHVAPHGVSRVANDKGEVVWLPEIEGESAIPASVAATTAQMLRAAVENGTGTEADFGRMAAGKTGTTQSYRDAWFVGWAGDLSTAVWVGHREGQVEMTDVRGTEVTGGSFPARIWSEHMKRSYDGRTAE